MPRILLHDLVDLGQISEVSKLLDGHSVNVDEQCDLGRTAVMAAVNRNDLQVVKLLITKGHARIDLADAFGQTALTIAEKNRYTQISEYLKSIEK